MLVLLGYRHNKSQVGFHQLVLGSLSGSATLADDLGQFYLFIDGNHRSSAYLHQILIECLTISIGYTFLYLQLSHNNYSLFLLVAQ